MNLYFYTRGRHHYSVMVEDDGAIKVAPRDWLSKYSMAIYGTPLHVHEFARKRGGALRPIENVDLIHTGEVLYHLPTVRASQEGKQPPHPLAKGNTTKPGPHTVSLMTRDEQEEVAKQHLAREFNLRGEDLEWIGDALHSVEMLQDATEVVGITLEMFGVEGIELLEDLSAGLGAASLILTPVGITCHLVHALGAGHRLVQMAAMAVALTAWAYDDPRPAFPNFIRQQPHSGPADLRADEEVWQTGCKWAAHSMEELVAKINKKAQPRVRCSLDTTEAIVKVLLRSQPQFKGRRDTMAYVLAQGIVEKAPREDQMPEIVTYMATTFFNPNFDRRSMEQE
jgi:hypothetical protein